MTDPELVDGRVLFAAIGDFVKVRYPDGTDALARITGWADSIGRPVDRPAAFYVVVEGDVSAGDGWNRSTLIRLPAGEPA